ncbi:3-oxoacyl-[acyl-carrier-protein] synthase II [Pseudarthrobacter sp. PvP004]|uniref:beta-ketoacyl-[acyl-carrier-protein] synthase family protein n=1 Tax=Pseudarthrobacter sp. PvP004 TaxID=2817850 RepID=UPI001AE7E09E|nr:beta-ketoacyl-[acyl-carrier-protein] synthase family protein [Pseudarthrobacter sp. PvP004]MBP2265549.1 3-oxoacyl-[acyl-carrier-protein] synthase II [Pseudarthrobacter sp. PvP004]
MKIVVTGFGLRAAVGSNAEQSWESISNGKSGIVRTTVVPTEGLVSSMGGQVESEMETEPPSSRTTYVDRCHRLASAAATEALTHAGANQAPVDRTRIALSLGTSLGGARSGEEFHRQWIQDGLRKANTGLLRQYPLHSVADHLASEFQLFGPRSVQSNACAAGAVAIAYGIELLESDAADMVLAGGVDPLALLSFGGFSSLKALDPLHCAPYTRSSGLNLGEGAGFLVLESEASAVGRGAAIYAEIAGYGLSADAYHATAPDPMGRGALRAMHAALHMAGNTVEDVDYVNGHGTGTAANDSVEAKAITHLREGAAPPASSTKSMIGHTLGAAGAIEAVTSVLAIQNQEMPPTVTPDGLRSPTGLDIVAETAQRARLKTVLSNSFAFGGNNASLAIREYTKDASPRAPKTVRPVVITGIGALAGDAVTTEEVKTALFEGRPVYGDGTVEVDGFGSFPFGDIPADKLKKGIDPKYLRHMDTLGRRSALAVSQLLKQRGLSRAESTSTGLLFATGTGPISTVEAFERELLTTGSGNALLFPNTVMNAAPGHVALLNKLQGPTATICAGNTGAITALHFAQNLISNGVVDRMIVLAADEAPHAMLAAYAPIPGYLTRSACLPYSNTGRIISGAAVAILLESEDSVDPGRVLGRIEHFGMTGDGSGPSRLRRGSEAWVRSFRLALGSNPPETVDAVVAAACGRDAVDSLEVEALAAMGLGGRPVSTPKAIFGDAGASGGLLGVAQAVWMSQEKFIPGTAGVVASGPEGLVPPSGKAGEVNRTLVSTCEAGGSFQSVTIAT